MELNEEYIVRSHVVNTTNENSTDLGAKTRNLQHIEVCRQS